MPLKFETISDLQLIKGDIVFHQGAIWQCTSKQMQLFINLDTREQTNIASNALLKINKLELIPKEWKFNEERVQLKGQ